MTWNKKKESELSKIGKHAKCRKDRSVEKEFVVNVYNYIEGVGLRANYTKVQNAESSYLSYH